MASQIPEEVHIRHCMLFEFHKGSNATVATKNICDPSALDVRNCQSGFLSSNSVILIFSTRIDQEAQQL